MIVKKIVELVRIGDQQWRNKKCNVLDLDKTYEQRDHYDKKDILGQFLYKPFLKFGILSNKKYKACRNIVIRQQISKQIRFAGHQVI